MYRQYSRPLLSGVCENQGTALAMGKHNLLSP